MVFSEHTAIYMRFREKPSYPPGAHKAPWGGAQSGAWTFLQGEAVAPAGMRRCRVHNLGTHQVSALWQPCRELLTRATRFGGPGDLGGPALARRLLASPSAMETQRGRSQRAPGTGY